MTGRSDSVLHTRAARGQLDVAQRRVAARIAAHRPRWVVLWGLWSRRYWAFPLFDAEPGTIISSASANELVALLDHAETAAALGHPPRRPGNYPASRQVADE